MFLKDWLMTQLSSFPLNMDNLPIRKELPKLKLMLLNRLDNKIIQEKSLKSIPVIPLLKNSLKESRMLIKKILKVKIWLNYSLKPLWLIQDSIFHLMMILPKDSIKCSTELWEFPKMLPLKTSFSVKMMKKKNHPNLMNKTRNQKNLKSKY